MSQARLAAKIADAQAAIANYRAQAERARSTCNRIMDEYNVAFARSQRILARFLNDAAVSHPQQVVAEPSGNGTRALGASNCSLIGAPRLKKGDRTLFNDEGWSCEAVVVEILSSRQAIIRVLEGRLAGEEVEAYFPNGALASLHSHSVLVRKAKPKLVVIKGSSQGVAHPPIQRW